MSAPRLGLEASLSRDAVTEWLRPIRARLVGDESELPVFGSPEWHLAPDPVRLASALRAAEAWRRQGITLPQTVADDLAATDYQAQLDDTDEWHRLGAWVRRAADGPDHAELVQRRTVVTRPTVPTQPAVAR